MAFDLIRNDITFKIVVMILNISNINYTLSIRVRIFNMGETMIFN